MKAVRDWWRCQLAQRGYEPDLIERLLAEYEARSGDGCVASDACHEKACPNSLWSCAGRLRLAVNGGVVHFGVSVSCQICIVRRRLRLMRRSVSKPAKDQARRHQPAVAPAPFLL